MKIPAGFCGYVYVPVPENDLTVIDKFLLAVEESEATKNKTIYFSDFTLVKDKEYNFFPLEELALGETNNEGGWEMVVWFNEYSGKLLTGVSLQYDAAPTKELLDFGNRLAKCLADVQYEDGYLGIYRKDVRLGRNQNWDIWGHYHQIFGLLSWYRVSGNKQALETAVKAADCIYNEFYGAGRSMDEFGENQHVNFSTTHAFAELYKETGDRKYLDAVMKNVNEEWPKSGNWMNLALEGKDFYESSLPRWESIHPVLTLATLYELTGEEKYKTAFCQIWKSIRKTDRHNTGAFSTVERAQGNPYMDGPVETCCTVAWQAMTAKYLELTGDPSAADEAELTYFNGIFGSLLDGERLSTYDTRTEGKMRIPARDNFYNDANFFFHSGATEFTCCQANIARGVSEVVSWALLTDKNGIYLNYYGAGTLTAKTPAGKNLTLSQETDYPASGIIKITIDGDFECEDFTLNLRIPAWAGKTSVTVNGSKNYSGTPGSYLSLQGPFKPGETLELSMEMPFHYWVHENDTAKASIYKGPILYSCSENVNLSRADIEASSPAFAVDGKHWLYMDVKTADGVKRFFDFASIGKFDEYKTWFNVDNLPSPICRDENGTSIWCNV